MVGVLAHYLLRPLALGHAEQHAQRLAQRLGFGREHQGGAAVEVLAVVALVGLPQVLVDAVL